jgi:SRSO17 transposase
MVWFGWRHFWRLCGTRRADGCAPAYIAGLIGPGDRKSVQPMAARDGEFGYDQLHHFVADGVWDSAPLEAVLLKEADRLVGDEAGYLVIAGEPGKRMIQ